MAASASSPSVMMMSDEPHSAASIITPRMLLPFTARSSLRTSTADLKRLATLTNSAAGQPQRRAAPRRGPLRQRLMQGDRDAHAVRPARPQRPPAQPDVPDVVHDQEADHRVQPEPQRHADERERRRDGEPPRPDQAVAERPERAAQGAAQPLHLLRGRTLVLGPRRRSHRESAQVGVRVEEVRAPRDGRSISGAILPRPQVSQQRLLRHPDPDPLQALVVPRALHGEQPQQGAAERRAAGARHRSQTSTVPPSTPATNHARLAPRPTTRSVPAVAAASAAATAAMPSSVTPRSGSVPARNSRTRWANPSPAAVTAAARSASRAIAETCSRTSRRASPASSRSVTACTARAVARRTMYMLKPPSMAVTRPTSAPNPRPSAPAAPWAALTAATVAGPYSG